LSENAAAPSFLTENGETFDSGEKGKCGRFDFLSEFNRSYSAHKARTAIAVSLYDHTAAEGFTKTFKNEKIYLRECWTINDVQNRLPYFIEEGYNRSQLRSALGYRPPAETEELFCKNKPCPAALILSV